MNTSRCILIVLIGALVSACTTLPDIPITPQSQQRWDYYQLQAGRIDRWHLQGRAAIFTKDEVHNVGLSWEYDPDAFVMTLEAPFGQGVIRLVSDNTPNGVSLSTIDGRVVVGESAEAVLKNVVGWSIPVSGLASWVKGLPLKQAAFESDLNGDGRLKSLSQNGWKINYLDYFGFNSDAQGLPRKMYLKHDQLALKIVIDSWQRPKPTNGNELFPDFD